MPATQLAMNTRNSSPFSLKVELLTHDQHLERLLHWLLSC